MNHFSRFHRFASLTGCVALALGVFSVPRACAEELRLKNGDRITGTIIERAAGKIRLRSPLLGELTILEQNVVPAEKPDVAVESLAGLPPVPPKGTVPAAASPDAAPPTSDTVPAAAEVSAPRWKGKIEFGLANQQGRNDASNLSVRGDAEKTRGVDNFRVNGRYLYGKTGETITSDRRDANFRWRHDLSPNVFTQAISSYVADAVALIDYDLSQNMGVGYKFLRRPRHTASVGSGVTLQYRSGVGLDNKLIYLGEIFQDYTYKINGHFTLLQEAGAMYSPEASAISSYAGTDAHDTHNYKLRFNSTLQGKISQSISLNIRYEYEYDAAIVDVNARGDQRITSSIGYAF